MVIAGVDYMTYSAKAKGEPVDIVYPKSGTVISPRSGIMKDSKMLKVQKSLLIIYYPMMYKNKFLKRIYCLVEQI